MHEFQKRIGMIVICITLASLSWAKVQTQPNIVLIMCDDMGYSDLGCYGGEIRTPHIDALAREGIRFSRFKNTGRCCPSRASLMTGRHQHAVEMGWMTAVDEHRLGYRGQLSPAVPTIAEILKPHGYGTYLSGKWHLTVDGNWKEPTAGPNGSWPTQRGFDESYGGLSGGGGYYRVNGLVRNETRIDNFPDDYYYTTAITRHAVAFIEKHDRRKPLFLYLAHYAPHRPLEAPRDRVDACRDRYRAGYDVLRAARFRKLKERGLLSTDLELPVHQREYRGGRPAWESLSSEKQEAWIEEMARFAAMIEIMDDGIGEVVAALKRQGLYEDAVLVFLSDNGATYEGGLISQLGADLSNTPYRSYKQFTFHGGISTPFIVHGPKRFGEQNGEIRHDLGHITDIVPTLLDLAGIDYPRTFHEQTLAPVDGRSLVPALLGRPMTARDLFFEHQTSSAVISEGWKLVRRDAGVPWELIHLEQDPFEQHNAASDFPDVVRKLEAKWNAWGIANNVFPLETRGWTHRIKHYQQLNPYQDGID